MKGLSSLRLSFAIELPVLFSFARGSSVKVTASCYGSFYILGVISPPRKVQGENADKRSMKHLLSSLLVIGLITSSVAVSADGNAPVVQNEYAKQQTELEAKLVKQKRLLRDLKNQEDKATEASKAEAQVDTTGLSAMKRYDTLMTGRYATDQGDFQGWKTLSAEDIENINKLFETYLHSKPLSGRVSAGQAHNQLDWGMSRLEELSKMHRSPNSENNSDLEIIAHQRQEAEAAVKSVNNMADRLGLKLTDPQLEEADQSDATRAPASEPVQTQSTP